MLPLHQSVVNVDAQMLDEAHYRRVDIGEPIKTHFEAFLLMPTPHWAISSFFSSDKQHVTGRTVYRSPASIKAWVAIARPLLAKWWYRWTKTPSTL